LVSSSAEYMKYGYVFFSLSLSFLYISAFFCAQSGSLGQLSLLAPGCHEEVLQQVGMGMIVC